MRKRRLIVLFSILTVIALIVIVNSVLFSVREVTVYCYNDIDLELESEVLEKAEIKKGSNIFFLSENKIIERLNKIANIEVINIERIPFSKVSINFAKILEYIAIPYENTFVICDNKGKVLRFDDNPNDAKLISIKLRGGLDNPVVGEKIKTIEPNVDLVVVGVMEALSRLNYRDTNEVHLISEIDVTNPERVFLQARQGVRFEIIGTQNLLEKMQYAISIYLHDDPIYKTSGLITVWKNSGQEPDGSYLATP